MAKKGQPVSEAVFEKIEQETKNLLAKAVPAPDKQLCLFEGWADWNAKQAAKTAKNPRSAAGLTLAQEIFANLVAAGYTKTEAYRAAYPGCKTDNLNTIYPKASRLAKEGKIRARIDALQKEVAEKALMSPTEFFQRLTNIARGTGKDALDALKQIGQIRGLFKPEKETSVNIGPALVVQTVDYANAEASSTGEKATGTPQTGEVAK
nr:MAG TPA: Terminase small subunit [Caudoviricetes sp.]